MTEEGETMNRPDARALIETLAERAQAEAGGGEALEPEEQMAAEELLDYLRGTLPPEDEERVSRRLVADPAAARALLDVAELEEAATAADESHLPDPETRAGWRDLEARLPKSPAPPRRGGFFAALPVWLSPAVATVLLMVVGGLGVRVAQLERQLGAPSALVAVELPLTERSGEKEAPAGEPLALVVPIDRAPDGCTDLRAAITTPGGERWPLTPVPDALGFAYMMLPAAAPGSYSVTVSACGEPLGEATLRLVAAAGGGGDG